LRHYAPLESVAEAFINFPDPWPKRRHAPNRLIQAPFAENLKMALKKGGSATLATDDLPYKEQMVQVFSAGWDPILAEQNMPGYGDSFFASLWKSKGKELFYLKYRKKND
jgi:tRNA (guanine-N7-)-methyltransferase